MIYVGAVLGGPDVRDSGLVTGIQTVSRAFDASRPTNTEHSATLDLVFHVPGNLISPKFDGQRTAKFSRRERTLMIQIAVPTDKIHSDCPEQFLFASIAKAIPLGVAHLEKRGLSVDAGLFEMHLERAREILRAGNT